MSAIDARKDAYTIAVKIFQILGVEVIAEKLWLVIDEVFAVEERADRLESMVDRMSETLVEKDEQIFYLKEKYDKLVADITRSA